MTKALANDSASGCVRSSTASEVQKAAKAK